MLQNRGIAIVSVLIIMVAVMVLGAGALFLTQMNLNIASNVRSNAVAKYNARTGIQNGLYQLEEAYRQAIAADPVTASFPGSLSLGTASGPGYAPTYNLLSYERDAANASSARFAVRGLGPSDAEHVSEVLVMMVPGQPEFPPGFSFGLASEGRIYVNGNSSYINAGIHGNGGFELTGNVGDDFYVCVQRDSAGVCVRKEAVPLADAPVSASPGATTCSPAELCDGGTPRTLVSPISVNPAYVSRRNRAIEDVSSSTGLLRAAFAGHDVQCDYVVTSQANLEGSLPAESDRVGKTLCITTAAEVTFPSGFRTNGLNIISNGGLVFPQKKPTAVSFSDSLLISMSGRVRLDNDNGDVGITDTRIFSEGAINFNGTKVRISGVTTLASNSSITVNGGAPSVSAAAGPSVGLTLIATDDVTVNGSADWYVAATVGGSFTQNGTATVYGVIEAKRDITINGGIDIDAGLPIVNDDGKVDGPPRIQVVSIR